MPPAARPDPIGLYDTLAVMERRGSITAGSGKPERIFEIVLPSRNLTR